MTIWQILPICGQGRLSDGNQFSRVLTLRYGNSVSNYLNSKYQAISVGRVMTCVLGMVVRREREIRSFVKPRFTVSFPVLHWKENTLMENGEQ